MTRPVANEYVKFTGSMFNKKGSCKPLCGFETPTTGQTRLFQKAIKEM